MVSEWLNPPSKEWGTLELRREAKSLLPFEFAEGTDEHGFTADDAEQHLCLVMQGHMNVPVRVDYNPRTHWLALEEKEGDIYSLILYPFDTWGNGEPVKPDDRERRP